MTTARRTCKSWKLRLRMVTKLLFSSLHDVHIVFCYITSAQFYRIKVAFNNAIRNTGFINTTPSKILAASATRYQILDFCVKGVITLGLKQIPGLAFDRVDKLRIRVTEPHTFHGTFIRAWNDYLPRDIRKSLILAYNSKNHSMTKRILKSHFRLEKATYEDRIEHVWTQQ